MCTGSGNASCQPYLGRLHNWPGDKRNSLCCNRGALAAPVKDSLDPEIQDCLLVVSYHAHSSCSLICFVDSATPWVMGPLATNCLWMIFNSKCRNLDCCVDIATCHCRYLSQCTVNFTCRNDGTLACNLSSRCCHHVLTCQYVNWSPTNT